MGTVFTSRLGPHFRQAMVAAIGVACLTLGVPVWAQEVSLLQTEAALVIDTDDVTCSGDDCSTTGDDDISGCEGECPPPVVTPPVVPPVVPQPVTNQSNGGCRSNCTSPPKPVTTPGSSAADRVTDLVALSTGNTDTIVQLIADANRTCGSNVILRKYRIDCLRVYYKRIADSLPDNGEYYPIKVALTKAAGELDAIVRANLDTTAPTIRPRERNKPFAPRMPALRAVTEKSEARVIAQAQQVVADTQMLILRSGGDPKRRSAHYQEIAAAVDSNILLLRSA